MCKEEVQLCMARAFLAQLASGTSVHGVCPEATSFASETNIYLLLLCIAP